jgi:hypothetical protein
MPADIDRSTTFVISRPLFTNHSPPTQQHIPSNSLLITANARNPDYSIRDDCPGVLWQSEDGFLDLSTDPEITPLPGHPVWYSFEIMFEIHSYMWLTTFKLRNIVFLNSKQLKADIRNLPRNSGPIYAYCGPEKEDNPNQSSDDTLQACGPLELCSIQPHHLHSMHTTFSPLSC